MDKLQVLICIRTVKFVIPIINSPIAAVVERWKQKMFGYLITCQSCIDKGPAKGYCKNCNCFIDQGCIGYHEKINELRCHKYIDFSKKSRKDMTFYDLAPIFYCTSKIEHRKQKIEYFSMDCNTFFCGKCIENCNQDKSMVKLVDIYKLLDIFFELKREIDSMLCERLKDFPESQQDILKFMARMMMLVTEYKDVTQLRPSAKVEWTLKRNFSDIFSLPVQENIFDICRETEVVIKQLRGQQNEPRRICSTKNELREDTQQKNCASENNVVDEYLPMSEEHKSFASGDLFGSYHGRTFHQKLPEEEIKALQRDYADPQGQINLDSYENIRHRLPS